MFFGKGMAQMSSSPEKQAFTNSSLILMENLYLNHLRAIWLSCLPLFVLYSYCYFLIFLFKYQEFDYFLFLLRTFFISTVDVDIMRLTYQ